MCVRTTTGNWIERKGTVCSTFIQHTTAVYTCTLCTFVHVSHLQKISMATDVDVTPLLRQPLYERTPAMDVESPPPSPELCTQPVPRALAGTFTCSVTHTHTHNTHTHTWVHTHTHTHTHNTHHTHTHTHTHTHNTHTHTRCHSVCGGSINRQS